jgi:hypothetical protein
MQPTGKHYAGKGAVSLAASLATVFVLASLLLIEDPRPGWLRPDERPSLIQA